MCTYMYVSVCVHNKYVPVNVKHVCILYFCNSHVLLLHVKRLENSDQKYNVKATHCVSCYVLAVQELFLCPLL